MKKIISLFLTVLFALSAAVCSGCSKEVLPLPEISDYDSEAVFPVGDESQSTDAAPSGNFVVRDRKYTYEENDLALLYVENQTNQNYTLTINGAYLDENGEVLREETQTFEGFEAGWQNYFLFQPNIAFDRFTYTLETEVYTGECAASQMQLGWTQEVQLFQHNDTVSWEGYGKPVKKMQKQLSVNIYFTNHGTVPMDIAYIIIVLDSSGEIFSVYPNYISATYPPEEKHHREVFLVEDIPVEDDITLPEELQDGFTILIPLKNAKWNPTWTNQTGEG